MKKSIWLLVLAFAIVGCSGSHDGGSGELSQTFGVIYPLAVGNTWRYSVIQFDENNKITDQFSTTRTVLADSSINGHHAFFENNNGFELNRSDGLWFFSSNVNGFLFLKYPCSLGDKYSFTQFDPSSGLTDSINILVLSVNERVSVPAGVFHCIKYQIILSVQSQQFTINYYASPNVGIIETETIVYDQATLQNTHEVMSLLEYDLKK